jgi:flagellar hook assembly protein FlgD
VPYPNPCREKGSTFFYELTSDGAVDISEVVLKIYSVSGRLVTELTDPSPRTGRGSIHWDLADRHGEVVANGMYICRAIATNSSGKKARILTKLAVAR